MKLKIKTKSENSQKHTYIKERKNDQKNLKKQH